MNLLKIVSVRKTYFSHYQKWPGFHLIKDQHASVFWSKHNTRPVRKVSDLGPRKQSSVWVVTIPNPFIFICITQYNVFSFFEAQRARFARTWHHATKHVICHDIWMVFVLQEVQIMISRWQKKAEHSRMCWHNVQWSLATYMCDQHMPRDMEENLCTLFQYSYGIVYWHNRKGLITSSFYFNISITYIILNSMLNVMFMCMNVC
jgi:hypothetical protein